MLSIMRNQHRISFKVHNMCLNIYNRSCASVLDNYVSPTQFKCLDVLRRKYNNWPSSHPNKNEGPFASRYHPTSPIESTENRIKEVLSTTSPEATEEWDEIKTELMNENECLTELNFGGVMMNSLLLTNKLKEAHSFMDYLKKKNMDPNHLIYLKYMDICGRNFEQCDQNVILQAYHKVKPMIEAVPVLDRVRAEHVVQGLCGTDQWFLALDYLKKSLEKSNKMKSNIAAAAIRHNDENLAWEIITKWFKADDNPNDTVFKAFLLYCLKLQEKDSKRSEHFLIRFLNYLQQKGVILKEEHALLIEKYFRGHSSNWNISYSKVNRSGDCEICKKTLQIMDFSVEDFTHLRKAFLEKSVKRSDLFINTTQEEFNQYIRFIENHKPFHIVLDGLNVAHTLPRTKSNKLLAQHLLKVVEKLWRPSRKLLVLGRNHMRMWPRNIMEKISRKAVLFLTNNISQDDPFMIYAALESGPHSYVVSLDLLRDHMSRLDDPKSIALFKRWQQTHQIYFNVDENKELKFVEPLKYSINIQGDMKYGWHIPFDDKIILDTYEELNNWLCIQKPI